MVLEHMTPTTTLWNNLEWFVVFPALLLEGPELQPWADEALESIRERFQASSRQWSQTATDWQSAPEDSALRARCLLWWTHFPRV